MSIWTDSGKWGALPGLESVTLGEGDTPLVRSEQIGRQLGLRSLWFKLEGANPTGSYKDRFASAAVSYLRHDHRRGCLATTSGNTGSALAAYCARAKLPCHILVINGAPKGKIRQMQAYGARVYTVHDYGRSAAVNASVRQGLAALAREIEFGFEVSAHVYSPRAMAALQTISFEIAAKLSGAMDVFCPAGGGGLTLAVARGFAVEGNRARVHCVQPAGNDTIASALRSGANQATAVASTTAISGLQVGAVLDGDAVIAGCRKSGGQGHVVKDEDVFQWHQRLARDEGIFCEPAGATALAGAAAAVACGEIPADQPVVCLVTGSGFKDERGLQRMTADATVTEFPDFAHFATAVKITPAGPAHAS